MRYVCTKDKDKSSVYVFGKISDLSDLVACLWAVQVDLLAGGEQLELTYFDFMPVEEETELLEDGIVKVFNANKASQLYGAERAYFGFGSEDKYMVFGYYGNGDVTVQTLYEGISKKVLSGSIQSKILDLSHKHGIASDYYILSFSNDSQKEGDFVRKAIFAEYGVKEMSADESEIALEDMFRGAEVPRSLKELVSQTDDTQVLTLDLFGCDETPNVEFISYDGSSPNLCGGELTLKIDGKFKRFENCLVSGGTVTSDYLTEEGPWTVDLPDEYKHLEDVVTKLVNENVERGCCGGCI